MFLFIYWFLSYFMILFELFNLYNCMLSHSCSHYFMYDAEIWINNQWSLNNFFLIFAGYEDFVWQDIKSCVVSENRRIVMSSCQQTNFIQLWIKTVVTLKATESNANKNSLDSNVHML